MKVSELKINNDLAKLLSEVYVSGTGSNARKALENMDGVSITYSSTMKKVPVLKDLKTGISIELSEQLELASLTQLAKEFGFGGTAYQAGNLLNKNFMSIATAKLKTSKDVFEECFDVATMMVACRDTLSCIVDSFIDVPALSDIDKAILDRQLSRVKLAFMTAEERYEILKKSDLLSLSEYFVDSDYEDYLAIVKQESRFDALPDSVQVINERDDGYVLVKSTDYMSVEDFISLQVKLKECAVDGTLTISKTVVWEDDGITVDSVAVTATLCLK